MCTRTILSIPPTHPGGRKSFSCGRSFYRHVAHPAGPGVKCLAAPVWEVRASSLAVILIVCPSPGPIGICASILRMRWSISLQQYSTGTYWGPPHTPFLPRIDFIYHSPHWQVVDARVIQQKASDHFPVLAILSPAVQAHDPSCRAGRHRESSSARPRAGSNLLAPRACLP